MKTCFLFLAVAAHPAAAAAVSYTGGTYSQNFNSLASTGLDIAFSDETTLPGWTAYSGETNYAGTGAFPFTLGTANTITDAYDADTGSATTGELMSYGSAATPADRAFGSIASGTSDKYFFVLHVTNDTGSAGTGFTLEYTGEQWRRGANAPQRAESLLFFYRVGGTAFDATGTWTEVTTLAFISPSATLTTGAALDGNDSANRLTLSDTLAASIAPGEHLWLAWIDPDNTGTDHGMALDDVSFTINTVPEPSAAALAMAGAGLCLRRRRVRSAR